MSHQDETTRRNALLGGMLGAGALALAGSADAAVPPAWIETFVDLFYVKKNVKEAFDRFVAADYIQHSKGIGQGPAAAVAVLGPMFGRPDFHATPVRTFMDGDLVCVFLDIRVGAAVRAFVVDIFRVRGDKVVEHWDLKTELTADEARNYFQNLTGKKA